MCYASNASVQGSKCLDSAQKKRVPVANHMGMDLDHGLPDQRGKHSLPDLEDLQEICLTHSHKPFGTVCCRISAIHDSRTHYGQRSCSHRCQVSCRVEASRVKSGRQSSLQFTVTATRINKSIILPLDTTRVVKSSRALNNEDNSITYSEFIVLFNVRAEYADTYVTPAVCTIMGSVISDLRSDLIYQQCYKVLLGISRGDKHTQSHLR